MFKSTVNKNQQTYSQKKKINKLHQFPFDQNSYDLSREDKSIKKNSRLTGGNSHHLLYSTKVAWQAHVLTTDVRRYTGIHERRKQ
jgi:hypothetical protein